MAVLMIICKCQGTVSVSLLGLSLMYVDSRVLKGLIRGSSLITGHDASSRLKFSAFSTGY